MTDTDETFRELDRAIEAHINQVAVTEGREPGVAAQWVVMAYVSRPTDDPEASNYFKVSSRGLPSHSARGLYEVGSELSMSLDPGWEEVDDD